MEMNEPHLPRTLVTGLGEEEGEQYTEAVVSVEFLINQKLF